MTTKHSEPIEQQFREIDRLVALAAEEGMPCEDTGKRSGVRHRTSMRLDVTTDRESSASSWPVTMHNIGEDGFAFWSKREMRTHADIWVREFTEGNSATWIPAMVTHCTVGIRGFLIGAKFTVTSTRN